MIDDWYKVSFYNGNKRIVLQEINSVLLYSLIIIMNIYRIYIYI